MLIIVNVRIEKIKAGNLGFRELKITIIAVIQRTNRRIRQSQKVKQLVSNQALAEKFQ